MSGSQVYDQRAGSVCPCEHCTSGRTRAAVRKHMTLREPMRETTEIAMKNVSTLVCHCGKYGHALNSVNCPVHGAKNMRDAEEHYAKLAGRRGKPAAIWTEAMIQEVARAKTEALAHSMPRPDAVAAKVLFKDAHVKAPPGYVMTITDLDEDADAYEAAAREEFEPRPIAMVYDYTTIHHFADQLRFEEDEATAASQDDINAARERQPYHRASSAGVFNFDAIRYHLNVMHGDDINGTTYLHHTRRGGPSAIRAHDFDPLTQRCTACLWSAQHVLDRIINHCEGRPPKGERCMNCGKPHVVSIQHRGNWMTQCLSCFQGVMTHGPIPDRGAVRFEQRMKERAERDYAKAWKGYPEVRGGHHGRIGGEPVRPLGGLQAVEDYLKHCENILTPEDKASIQALLDSAHMGGMAGAFVAVDGIGRIAGPTRADRMEADRLAKVQQATDYRNRMMAIAADVKATKAVHPEACCCDVCIPF